MRASPRSSPPRPASPAPWRAASGRPDRLRQPSPRATLGRLREDSRRFSSTLSVMISTSSRPMPFSFAASSLVLGESSVNFSTTASRSSRASCDRIELTPARYILRLSFWLKFSSGRFGKNLAAAAPQRRGGAPGARAAGALLLPRLLVRLVDLAARLLLARALPRVGQVGGDDLVHQRLVVLAAERRRRMRQPWRWACPARR